MNKKVFLGLFATSAMMFGTACSSEDLIEQGGGNTATVSFTLSAEGAAQSRAYSDGSSAKELSYAFYDKDGKWLEDISVWGQICDDLLTGHTIDAQLVKGQKYTVVVFASSPNAPYGVISNDQKFIFKMHYDAEGFNCNNAEYRDAFYKTYEFTVTGDESINLELTRPFAQINVGTTDYEAAKAAGFDVVKSKVVIKNAASEMDLYTGEVSGSQEVVYEYAPFTTEETLNVDGQEYTWLSMCYVLPNEVEGSTTVEAAFTFADESEGKTVELKNGLENMPIQRNYRTNILGQLLTNELDFVVKIDKNFTNSYKHDVWSGDVANGLSVDAEGNYLINSAADFAYLMKSTQNANSAYAGKTIILNTDINFDGRTITGVGSMYCNFAGHFDGNGHTITNFVIDTTDRDFYAGLFNQMTANGSVKNLTVTNATIVGNKMAGVVASSVEGGSVVENCYVKNSTVIAKIKKAGAVVGYTAGGTVKGCTAENVEVFCADPAEAESGEIVGYTNINSTVENNVATNVNVYRGTTMLRTAADLVAFAESFANYNNQTAFTGLKYVLGADIDLAGVNWTPMGQTRFAQFSGEFDGRGYTIKNLTINDNATELHHATGFFGWVYAGVIKNVNFVNANVKGHHNTAVVAGYVEKGTVENVTVDGAVVECTHATDDACGDKAGVLVGYVNPDGATLKNSVAKNSTVKGCRGVGQLAGFASLVDVVNCTAQNVEVIALSGCTSTKAGTYVGGLVGQYNETEITSINTAVEFDAFAKSVNELKKSYYGKTVTLNANIDFGGNVLKPIGLTASHCFYGTFDGNGKTISNFTINYADASNVAPASGVFGWLYGTVKNLTVRNAKIYGNHNVGAVVGCVSQTGAVESCHVYESELECSHANGQCGDKCGAVVGMVTSDYQAKVVNCTANNSTVKACRDAGQVIGCAYSVNTIQGNTASSVIVSALTGCDDENAGENINQTVIGRQL